MKIIATSDLHYDVARSKAPTESIARQICDEGADVLLFVGDTAGVNTEMMEKAFALFDSFHGIRAAVAGNHELWTHGGDSMHRWQNEVAGICSRNGVHYLDAAPLYVDDVGFVGNVGWYDYSYRPLALEIPLRFYQNKVSPGAAARLEQHKSLLETADDVPAAARDITTRWMDGERVKLPMGDADFTELTAGRLRHHLEQATARVDRIVAAVHHLPFAELVPHTILPNWEFATAFLGSERLGETLLDFPQVTHAYCGHSHQRRTCRKGHMICTSIGSNYREKEYEVLEL